MKDYFVRHLLYGTHAIRQGVFCKFRWEWRRGVHITILSEEGMKFAHVKYRKSANQVKTHYTRCLTFSGCPNSVTALQDGSATPAHDTRRRTENVRATDMDRVDDSTPERSLGNFLDKLQMATDAKQKNSAHGSTCALIWAYSSSEGIGSHESPNRHRESTRLQSVVSSFGCVMFCVCFPVDDVHNRMSRTRHIHHNQIIHGPTLFAFYVG